MALDERIITQAIVERWHKKFQESLDVDVCIVGGGPAGIVAGYFLSTWGHRVSLFERKLSLGGGMWGGGMMFNEIVVQEEAREILDQFGVPTVPFTGEYFCADSVMCTTTLASKATLAGLRIWNLMCIEDVVMRSERITGLVINWSAVEIAGLHVLLGHQAAENVLVKATQVVRMFVADLELDRVHAAVERDTPARGLVRRQRVDRDIGTHA